MNRAERQKAFADCDRAAAKVADPTTGRFDLGEVRAYLKREMKTRLMGVKSRGIHKAPQRGARKET
jgi:hypothetical protein